MTLLLIAAMTFLVAAAWVGIWYVFPEAELSLFRHRLWRLRDELHCAIRHGEFKQSPEPECLLRNVESIIFLAPEISALTSIVLAMYLRSRPPDPRTEQGEIRWSEMNEYDRHALLPYSRRFDDLLLHHIFFGSPSGWILSGIAIPPAFAYVSFRKAKQMVGQVFAVVGTRKHRDKHDAFPVASDLPSVAALTKSRVQTQARERGVERQLVGVIAQRVGDGPLSACY